MHKSQFLLAFLISVAGLFSCTNDQNHGVNPPTAGIPLGKQCYEYKGDKKRIHVRLLVEDTVVTGKYKEYVRDDIRAEYFTKSSSFRAICKKEGLDVFLTNESGIKSRAIWYLYPNQLHTGNFKCIPIACVESEEIRQKHIEHTREYIAIIDNHLGTLTKQTKAYQSTSHQLQGKVTAYYKNIHPLKLIDEQQSSNGRILTTYYFSEKKELVAIVQTEWRNASGNTQEVKHEDLFFKDKKLIVVQEKFKMQNVAESLNLEKVIASDITENISSTLASKSKRHVEEAFAVVGFVQSKKGYDTFFNH